MQVIFLRQGVRIPFIQAQRRNTVRYSRIDPGESEALAFTARQRFATNPKKNAEGIFFVIRSSFLGKKIRTNTKNESGLLFAVIRAFPERVAEGSLFQKEDGTCSSNHVFVFADCAELSSTGQKKICGANFFVLRSSFFVLREKDKYKRTNRKNFSPRR